MPSIMTSIFRPCIFSINKVAIMNKGRLLAFELDEVVTEENLYNIYGISKSITIDSGINRKVAFQSVVQILKVLFDCSV